MAETAAAVIAFAGEAAIAVAQGEATILQYTAYAAVTAVGSIQLQAALNTAFPMNGSGGTARKIPLRQSVPPRVSGFGKTRLGGYYTFFEEYDGDSYDALAVHDGQIDAVTGRFLHDDKVQVASGSIEDTTYPDVVTFGGDTREYSFAIRFSTTTGLSTEVAHPAIIDHPQYASSARGDGVVSIGLKCFGVKTEKFQHVYPNGLPKPSIEARLQLCFDPRNANHNVNDPSTWSWSDNPVIGLLNYFIKDTSGCMGFDYEKRILPTLDYWIAAANVCDTQVQTKTKGLTKRYTLNGSYKHTDKPSDVISSILAAFDGVIEEAGDGSLLVWAGQYYDPTFTLGDDDIIDISVESHRREEDSVNVIQSTYTSPDHAYENVSADDWVDDEEVETVGKQIVQRIALDWVDNHSQARRLMKRAMYIAKAPRVTIRTKAVGLLARGHRYIRLQCNEYSSTADMVGQIESHVFDPNSMTAIMTLVKVDSTIDDWDYVNEEGVAPAGEETSAYIGLSPPVISSIETLSDTGLRMKVNVVAIGRSYVSFRLRYRLQGATDYVQEDFNADEVVISGLQSLITAVVGAGTYEVECALLGPSGNPSAYSTPVIVTVTSAEAPSTPSGASSGTG